MCFKISSSDGLFPGFTPSDLGGSLCFRGCREIRLAWESQSPSDSPYFWKQFWWKASKPCKNGFKMKLQMKDEYSNGQQFQQLFVRKSLGLWWLVCPGNYCPGTEARAGCAQTCLQAAPFALMFFRLWMWGVGKWQADPWVYFPCLWLQRWTGEWGFPLGLAAGSRSLPGSQCRDRQRQQGGNPELIILLIIK